VTWQPEATDVGDGCGSPAKDLEVLDESVGAWHLEQRLRVPRGFACLEGHFPGFPVLPGIAQLDWAMRAGARLTGAPVSPTGIEALKFRELIRPGEEFSARVETAPDKPVLRLTVAREGRPVGSARIVAATPGPDLGDAGVGESGGVERPCAELVPQAGPMLALDRLVATDPRRTVCRVRSEGLPCFRAADGSLPGWAGLEPMAQCIAAHGGLYAPRPADGRPRVGFLLGCRRLEVRAERLAPDVEYAVAAVRLWGAETGLVSFDCELFELRSGRRLLAGRINAYLPEDLTGIMEGRLE